jgi:HAD superfamily hydrolase (TIGR01509 family)
LDAIDVSAVVFDMDGVLVDTEALNVRSAFEAFAASGHSLQREDAAQIVGRHPDDYVPLLGRRFGLTATGRDRLRRTQTGIYVRLWKDEARLIDGAEAVLIRLRERGYRLALATSGSRAHVRHCFDRFPLGGFFEIVLAKEDVARRKPDPEIYLRCADRLGLEPAAMLVVEDSEHGVRAALSAGAPCAAVRTPHTPVGRVRNADFLLGTLRELPDLLR